MKAEIIHCQWPTPQECKGSSAGWKKIIPDKTPFYKEEWRILEEGNIWVNIF